MIEIPAGVFAMGSSEPELDDIAASQHYPRGWFEDEAPQHAVAVGAFRIDRHPVTNRQFQAFTQATGYRTVAEERGVGLVYGERFWEEVPGADWRSPAGIAGLCAVRDRPDHPVVQVTWQDARTYAQWAGLRLPTEAEWEYAATGPDGTIWPWGNDWRPTAANTAERTNEGPITDMQSWTTWWSRCRSSTELPGTTPVGSLPTSNSAYGVADLAGQVMEWTESRYQPYDAHRSYGPFYERVQRAGYRALRGGGWMNYRFQTRTRERMAADEQYTTFAIGFRCAADA
ncbi:formylglycine-generating enzyme family protein [Streptomyces sp. WZ-12]|uniref:formylglycine-generating enzyme family protein n=1 Tax=Streptomyces sp. WZ-12 TaxID=3030210 RepID=UPI00238104F2|nr:SUMF1/EgtB/PvdO family nonheme iron enzyme [Streptomyces sp. WZ-12]